MDSQLYSNLEPFFKYGSNNISSTGKSLSEALIFASTNPQYDNRFFIELQLQL